MTVEILQSYIHLSLHVFASGLKTEETLGNNLPVRSEMHIGKLELNENNF